MIIKSYELNKIDLKQSKFVLFYGKNEGSKSESTNNLLKNKESISRYEEKEILENTNNFLENIFSKSLFENEKIIIIKRGTDKILKVLEQIIYDDTDGIIILVEASTLEKKSKLRKLFEKEKNCICVPFYPDNQLTLSRVAFALLKEKNISISSSDLNLIINKSNGDRKILFSELEKLEFYLKNGKKLTPEVISKLTNLIENHSISELVDNCLVKNKKKINHILNDNNYSNEDCILITRTFLNKSKKILMLLEEYEINKNIERTLSSANPPIFWKDKEIIKQQLYKQSSSNIKSLIYKVTELELLVKKNINNATNLVTDFILEQASS